MSGSPPPGGTVAVTPKWKTAQDGGPAFPTRDKSGYTWKGMSLRDYFAAKALLGMLSAEAHPESHGIRPLEQDEADGFAIDAYHFADAMLKAREQA